MKIMYVEDNPANISLLQRIARMGGHEVINYTNGETALSNFEKDHADLVLMDLQLEGRFSGLDVVKQLRERGFKTPIVAVTAYAMVGDRERCIEAGCDSYLSKPLPVAELVEMVQTYEQQNKPLVVPIPVAPAAASENGDKWAAVVKAPKAEEAAVKPPEASASTAVAVAPLVKPEAEAAAESTDKRTEEPTEPSRDATLDLSTPRASNPVVDTAAKTGTL